MKNISFQSDELAEAMFWFADDFYDDFQAFCSEEDLHDCSIAQWIDLRMRDCFKDWAKTKLEINVIFD